MSTYSREDLRRVVFSDLSERCDEALLQELCTQFGPVACITWPTTATTISGTAQRSSFCFVDFYSPEDAKYCYEALFRSHVKLFDKDIHVTHASTELAQRQAGGAASASSAASSSSAAGARMSLHEVGAKVIVRNVDRSATEFAITSFFEQFGPFAVPPRMMRDYVGNVRGTVILSYKDFAASDRAIHEMHEKVYRDRIITVQYAELEDGSGRLHGSPEERANAALIREEERKYQDKLARELAEARQARQRSRAQNTTWADNVDVYAAGRRY